MQGAWIRSLVEELGSHILHSVAKLKIPSYSFVQKCWATHTVPGWVHWIEMSSAIWGWSHSSHCLGSQVWLLSLFHSGGEWRSKSAHWCFRSADHCVTTLTSDSPNRCPSTVPLASVLIRCGYFFFFLTLRLMFPVLLNVCFLSCFSIADSHFNYILLIVFCTWASYIFLSLPLVLWACLHLLRCVCFSLPADLTSFFSVK